MKMEQRGLAVIFVCLSVSQAGGQAAGTFNSIANGCKDSAEHRVADAYSQGICFGLIQGILYSDLDVCQPPEINMAQALNAVVVYAADIPTRWHEPSPRIVQEALKAAWPCPPR